MDSTSINGSSTTDPFYNSELTTLMLWYAITGVTGFIGNTFILLVKCCSRPHLKPVDIGISWLAIVDLLGCMDLPFQYLYFYGSTHIPQSICAFYIPMATLIRQLSYYSLLPIAYERLKAIKNFDNRGHMSQKKIFTIISVSFICAATGSGLLPLTLYADNIQDWCWPLPWKINFHDTQQMAPIGKVTKFLIFLYPISGCLILAMILVLYTRIALLLRTRIAPLMDNTNKDMHDIETSPNQFPSALKCQEGDCEQNGKIVFTKNSFKNILPKNTDVEDNTCNVNYYDKSEYSPTDIPCCSYKDGKIVSQHQSTQSPEPVSVQSIEFTVRQSETGNDDQIHIHLPGQTDTNNPDLSINGPVQKSTFLSLSSFNDTDSIPKLHRNAQAAEMHNIYQKVTLMLFLATIITIATYGAYFLFLTVNQLVDIKLMACIFFHLLPINHAVNPFIYSIVNKSFRDDCKVFLNKVNQCIRVTANRQ